MIAFSKNEFQPIACSRIRASSEYLKGEIYYIHAIQDGIVEVLA